jgi:hypothetical protein
MLHLGARKLVAVGNDQAESILVAVGAARHSRGLSCMSIGDGELEDCQSLDGEASGEPLRALDHQSPSCYERAPDGPSIGGVSPH